MKIILIFVLISPLLLSAVHGQEFNEIYYLCADWGPAMKLPLVKGERTQFSATEEEIYFLKQVTTLRREILAAADPLTGSKTREVWTHRSIYLCKMRPDASGKTEIKELWRDPNFPVDVQTQSTWMDVNEKTRTIALAITYAGSDMTGLWTMGLDGSDLKRVLTPEVTDKYLQAINKPSWTPDGQWIVFEEELRGMNPNQYRITKCDRDGKNLLRLTEGPKDRQPSVSPDGARVVYVRDPRIKLKKDGFGTHWVAATFWLMDLEGTTKWEIPNPEAKPDWPAKGLWGSWPAWSPDGKRIHYIGSGCMVVEVQGGKATAIDQEKCGGWSHWGSSGFVGYTVGGILYTDSNGQNPAWLGINGRHDCNPESIERCRW